MAKGNLTQYISPAELADIKAELEDLSKLQPGAQTVKDAIEDLMPIIRGCRARGHSWKRIAESFSRVDGISSASLRKYAYELDPSLKESVKGIVPKVSKPKETKPQVTKPATTQKSPAQYAMEHLAKEKAAAAAKAATEKFSNGSKKVSF